MDQLTRGEWRYEAVSDACRVVVGRGRQKLILARLATKQIPEREIAANAKAMAAVKQLIHAATLATLNFERKQASGEFLGDDDHGAWTALDQALAKARGEA